MSTIKVNKRVLKFIEECIKLKGTKFKWYGRTDEGLDCAGLLLTARNRANFEYFEYLNYSRLPRNYNFSSIISEICNNSLFNNKKEYKFKMGDIILVKYKKLINPTHIIIYIGNGKYIHSDQKQGVVIEELNEDLIKSIHSVYTLK